VAECNGIVRAMYYTVKLKEFEHALVLERRDSLMSTLSKHTGNGNPTATSLQPKDTKEQIDGVLQRFDVLPSRFDRFLFKYIYVYKNQVLWQTMAFQHNNTYGKVPIDAPFRSL
jgi:hypothetical protein